MTAACVSPRWKSAEPCDAREDADLAHDGPDGLHVAPVDALALAEHVLAHDVVLALLELLLDELLDLRELLGAPSFAGERLDQLGLGRLVAVVAGLLVLDERGLRGSPCRQTSLTVSATSGGSVLRSKVRLGLPTAARMRSMSSRMGCAVLCANISASMMSASAASAAPPSTITMASFEAGDDHVDVGLGLLLERRVGDELAVDARDAHGRERAAPGDVRDVQRRATRRSSPGRRWGSPCRSRGPSR